MSDRTVHNVTLRQAIEGISGLETGRRHVIRISFPRIKLRFLQHSKPWADASFTLKVNGETVVEDGKTDSDGWIDERLTRIPRNGEVIVSDGTRTQRYELKFRAWQGAAEQDALKCRLHNLGHRCGDDPKHAIAEFESVCGDEPKGEHNHALCSRIEKEHGL